MALRSQHFLVVLCLRFSKTSEWCREQGGLWVVSAVRGSVGTNRSAGGLQVLPKVQGSAGTQYSSVCADSDTQRGDMMENPRSIGE